MTKRTYITVLVLFAFLFSLAAEGRRESPYPTLREDDWIKISSDAPGIVIERHGTDETMHVELTGRGSERYRLTVLRERDGVSVEVKKKQRIGVFLSDFFDAGLYISIPESWTEGEIEVETVSGAIRVEEFIEARDIGFGTVSGAITFTGLRADEEVEIESVSGAIRGSNVIASSLELSSVSGAIMIDRIEVFNGKEDLQVESVSGAIKLGETKAGNAHVGSVSGSVHLTLSPRYEGTVRASSLSGSISADITADHTSWSEKRTQGFSIGSGHNSIEVETTSGSIKIIQ